MNAATRPLRLSAIAAVFATAFAAAAHGQLFSGPITAGLPDRGGGDLDIVSGISDVGRDDSPGRIFALLNRGDGLGYEYLRLDGDFVYQLTLADADGDGDLDLFAPAEFNGGQVRYFQNLVPEPAAAAGMALGAMAVLGRRGRR